MPNIFPRRGKRPESSKIIYSWKLSISPSTMFWLKSWRKMVLFGLTGFYGWLEAQQKEKLWRLLKYLQTFVVEPWVVIGDFNAYLHASEKKSGR